MSARIIPAMTLKVAHEDVSIDLLCFEQALSALGDRSAAGKVTGYVEASLAANPGLAALGPFLPVGRLVSLPQFTIEEGADSVIRLWEDEE
jgi:phage tail protein X